MNDFNTGDIILFSGNGIVSKAIKNVTKSKWTHVGMVIKDPDFLVKTPPKQGIFLIESDMPCYDKPCVDIETGKHMFGVNIVDLEERVKFYDGEVCYRKLITDISHEHIKEDFRIVYNTTYHKHYDWNPIDLIDPAIHHRFWTLDLIFGIDRRRVNKFFCSALVAYTYTQMGLMKSTTEWSMVYPRYFADNSIFENNSELGALVQLKENSRKNLKHIF